MSPNDTSDFGLGDADTETKAFSKDTSGGPVMEEWQRIAKRKQDERESRILRYCQFRGWDFPANAIPSPDVLDVSEYPLKTLTALERQIVEWDATEIVQKTTGEDDNERVSALQVFDAFSKAAIAAQQVTNCLTEVFFEEGYERAKELDEHFKKHGKGVGPLHGVPFSIKDHIMVKGQDTASGYISYVGKIIPEEDCLPVAILRNAGAIIYVKTANPQGLMSLETETNIYGRTTNPFNRNLTPGGSSGGEGALIACHGSPFGMGTDIGGSIRYIISHSKAPAAWCGLYGLKPSAYRMPHGGGEGSHGGMDNIMGVNGPLARSGRDLALYCSVMLQDEPWLLEHDNLELPWNLQPLNLPKRFCFAFLKDDGVVRPHPPILEALERTRKALEAEGHLIVEWEPLDHQFAWDLISKLYLLDGGAEYIDSIQKSGEPIIKTFEWLLSFTRNRKPYELAETWVMDLERDAWQNKLLAHWNHIRDKEGKRIKVNGIICPVAPTLAAPHDTVSWWGYTSYWNLLDYSAVVFPTGRFKASTYQPPSDGTEHPVRNDVEKFIAEQWKPETYDNAPIALQIVAHRLNEEKVLALLEKVEEALKKH